MRNAFVAALLLGTFFLVATAQDSVTITSDLAICRAQFHHS
jgi:hypothetical protein